MTALTPALARAAATGDPEARGQLEGVIREELRRAYRYGIAVTVCAGGAPFGYPEEAGAVAAVLGAADACAAGEDVTALDGVRFLTVAEIAATARLAPMSVYRAIEGGELDAVRIGRVYRVREREALRYLGVAREEAGAPS